MKSRVEEDDAGAIEGFLNVVDRAQPWVRRAALDVLDGDFGDDCPTA